MFSNDIVGSSTADDGTRDPRTVRLFAEGVPTAETPAEAPAETPTRAPTGGSSSSNTCGRLLKPENADENSGMSPSRSQCLPVRETWSSGCSRPSAIHVRSVARSGAVNSRSSTVRICHGCSPAPGGGSTANT